MSVIALFQVVGVLGVVSRRRVQHDALFYGTEVATYSARNAQIA